MVDEEDKKARKEMGEKMKFVREKKNLTQAQVATDAGIHINYYARVERGEENPTFDIIRRIVKGLKAKSSEILPF